MQRLRTLKCQGTGAMFNNRDIFSRFDCRNYGRSLLGIEFAEKRRILSELTHGQWWFSYIIPTSLRKNNDMDGPDTNHKTS